MSNFESIAPLHRNEGKIILRTYSRQVIFRGWVSHGLGINPSRDKKHSRKQDLGKGNGWKLNRHLGLILLHPLSNAFLAGISLSCLSVILLHHFCALTHVPPSALVHQNALGCSLTSEWRYKGRTGIALSYLLLFCQINPMRCSMPYDPTSDGLFSHTLWYHSLDYCACFFHELVQIDMTEAM